MKKLIGIILGLAIIAVLGYYAYNLSQKSGKSDKTELIEFAIQNTENIDKIEISDPFLNASFTIQKTNNEWKDVDGNCVQKYPVELLLETFRKITFKSYVKNAAKENVIKIMAAKAKKVNIYENGKLVKTWYVGHATPDHYGTYMLLETPEIKSDFPVIMGMEGLNGILEPRFFVNKAQWACTNLFSVSQAEIKEVTFTNNLTKTDSYTIKRENADFKAYQNNVLIENVNQENLNFFTNTFEDIHFNKQNTIYNQKQVDSIQKSTPYASLKLLKKDGVEENYNFYLTIDKANSTKEKIKYDENYLWTFTKDNKLVRVQFFVIGPVLDGKDFFVDKTVNN